MTERLAVVTGSSSGIGLLTALELAARGWRVVATMRDLGRRGMLEEPARKAGLTSRLDARRLDVTEFDSLPGIVEGIVRDYGRIDALVNNAGFAVAGFSEELRLEELRRQFETNFFGQVAMTQAVLPCMRRQRSGHVIMVSSITGRIGQPFIGAYSASKFALEGWSESLRVETHSLGIRVSLVEPGSFKSDIWTRNVLMGEAGRDPNSPNYERAGRFVKFIRHDVPKHDAGPVARLIADIADDPNPRLRYIIGTDAVVQWWFRALSPWKLYERVVAKVSRID